MDERNENKMEWKGLCENNKVEERRRNKSKEENKKAGTI